MAGLQIPPHSRRLSNLAVLGLALVAAVSLADGIQRQILSAGPAPFPAVQTGASAARLGGAIPEATAAPEMPAVAREPRQQRRAALEAAADAVPPAAATIDGGQPALAAADVAATVPDQPSPPPSPPTSSAPDSDPPT